MCNIHNRNYAKLKDNNLKLFYISNKTDTDIVFLVPYPHP